MTRPLKGSHRNVSLLSPAPYMCSKWERGDPFLFSCTCPNGQKHYATRTCISGCRCDLYIPDQCPGHCILSLGAAVGYVQARQRIYRATVNRNILTPSLPWCHSKTTIKSVKDETIMPFCFLLAWACERNFTTTHSIQSRCTYIPGKYTVCRRVRPSFKPEILVAGSVKGLSETPLDVCI